MTNKSTEPIISSKDSGGGPVGAANPNPEPVVKMVSYWSVGECTAVQMLLNDHINIIRTLTFMSFVRHY